MATQKARTEEYEKERSSEAGTRHYCAVRQTPEPILAPDVSPDRARAIIVTNDKWANGTVVHYYFFDNSETDREQVFFSDGSSEWRTWVGEADQVNAVRAAFREWADLGIGLRFEEVERREDAEVRIGFMQGDGSWSYIGTYCLKIGAAKRTMSFGWDLTTQDGRDTALHEIGHALGLPHEHQNPNAGIVWNEEAVYADLALPPNLWSRQKAFDNIIRKLPADTVQGSSWDPDSIMHYPFSAGLIRQPERYSDGLQPRGGISERDRAWVRFFYPPLDDENLAELQVGRSEPLVVSDGAQQNFEILPQATRYYNIRTFGTCDSVMVLFEDLDGNPRYLTADDDGGEDRNASLRVKLFTGNRYILRIRMKYSDLTSPPTVMLW